MTESSSYLNRLFTTEQAANFLGISPRTLESMRWKGTGPKYVKVGRLVRYRIDDLESYISSRTQR